MLLDPKIQEFIERARSSGASEHAIVEILTGRGWPAKEIYEALAIHYERLTGIAIPRRAGAGAAAKDAFFYLLVFSTLATWTFGLGWVAFTLIDRQFADNLFTTPYSISQYDTQGVASALAAILVAFPIYLLLSRALLRDSRLHPEKLDSPVRKWLTYMALVIAASVFMGDLITALAFLLRGEITSRFLAKSFVVLAISGGVFFYHFGGVRKSEESESPSKWSRDAIMAVLSTFVVLIVVIMGFGYIGGPKNQRKLRADGRRVQNLFELSGRIDARWRSNSKNLPGSLSEVNGVAPLDPVTGASYEYHPQGENRYELCAVFAMASAQSTGGERSGQWSHPAGHYCFVLDATQPAQFPNVYSPY